MLHLNINGQPVNVSSIPWITHYEDSTVETAIGLIPSEHGGPPVILRRVWDKAPGGRMSYAQATWKDCAAV